MIEPLNLSLNVYSKVIGCLNNTAEEIRCVFDDI